MSTSRKSLRAAGLHDFALRRNQNVAAVALANKNARIVWALLAHDRVFEPNYGATA